MKKITAILCILTLVLSVVFYGCGNTDNNTPTAETTTNSNAEEIETDSNADETTAAKAENPLDLEAIEKMEAEDTFEVRIADKSVVEDYGLTVSMAGNDALVFEVENNSDETVTGFEIYLVGYDSNKEKVLVGMGATIHQEGQSRFVTVITPGEDTEIKPGESLSIMTRCKAETFESVKAIVGSYTDSNGEIHENPIAEDWYYIADDAKTLD